MTWNEVLLLLSTHDVNIAGRELDKCREGNYLYKEDDFRKDVKQALSTALSVVICNYTRKGLNQIGGGHWSPIGGFSEEKDMVLILDVAKFKYGSHWVPLKDMYNAMKTVDTDANRARGWMVLSKLDFDLNCVKIEDVSAYDTGFE
eukprot:UN22731